MAQNEGHYLRLRLYVGAMMATGLIAPANAQEASPQPAEAAIAIPAPFDCTLTEAVICKAGAACTPSEKVGELPIPARVLVHFEQQVIASVDPDGLPHISRITDFAQSGDILVILGIDGGTGWMMHGTVGDDELTFAAASDDFVVNAFGSCKPIE